MKQTGKKGVSAVDFFCIGFGAIVGVGWAVAINGWMTNCGGPVPAALGYLIIMVMMIPIGLCYAELVPMFPVAGGGMVFVHSFRVPLNRPDEFLVRHVDAFCQIVGGERHGDKTFSEFVDSLMVRAVDRDSGFIR